MKIITRITFLWFSTLYSMEHEPQTDAMRLAEIRNIRRIHEAECNKLIAHLELLRQRNDQLCQRIEQRRAAITQLQEQTTNFLTTYTSN